MKRHTLFLLLTALGAPLPAAAAASESDRSIAQSLFEDARRLMAKDDYAAACPKLQESQRLDPSGGTLLNLALCREKEGKLATAWSYFKQALATARRDDRSDRAEAAETHLAALQGRIPSIQVSVNQPRPDQEILLDGVVVGAAAWNTRMALDPGQHEVLARAPNAASWSQSVALEVGDNITVSVPALPDGADPVPVTKPSPDAAKKEGTAKGGSSALGWVVGGAGVVALGVGSVFGLDALAKQKKSDRRCPTTETCSGEGERLSEQANTAAWIADVGVGVGLVGVVVGTYLILRGGGADEAEVARRTRELPEIYVGGSRDSARLGLGGTW